MNKNITSALVITAQSEEGVVVWGSIPQYDFFTIQLLLFNKYWEAR